MEIYTLDQQWQRAVGVLEQLVQTESGKDKARYLVAMANILNYELASPVEAVEIYQQALDEDPDDRRSFERIERILTSQQDWPELARAFRRMIKRLGASPTEAQRPWLIALWGGLAELSRVRQDDLAAAAAATRFVCPWPRTTIRSVRPWLMCMRPREAKGLPEQSSCGSISWPAPATLREPPSRSGPWPACTASTTATTALSVPAQRFAR
jgi:hypothetical protein